MAAEPINQSDTRSVLKSNHSHRRTVKYMSQSSFKELKQRAEDVYKRYQAHFANKPRATRDLGLIDELIGELESVIEIGKEELNGGRNPALVSVLDMARENLNTYRSEREKIAEAQAGGGVSADEARLAREANLAFGRYYRHFANENRTTRDLGLLTEIIVELERIEKAFSELADSGEDVSKNHEVVKRNLSTYRDEYRAIERAQEQGTAQEQADILATLANDQFAIYRNHFAGKPRPTRRPGLLERVVNQLKRIHKTMFSLKQGGLRSQANDRNMDIVSQNLEVYKKELKEIRKAREGISNEQLAGSLGGAANEIMAEYRENYAGENRSTRDLDKLSVLCDQMCEIATQMRAIQREEPSDMNEKNLGIVIDSWSLYEQEYKKIEEVQQGS